MDNDFKQMVEKYKSELLRFRQEHGDENGIAATRPDTSMPSMQQPQMNNVGSMARPQTDLPMQNDDVAESAPSTQPQTPPADRPMQRPEPSVRPDMPPEIPTSPISRPEIPTYPVTQPEMPMVVPSAPEITTPIPDRITNDRGYIQIKTYTAREATPVANALVLILRDGELVYQTLTDEDGLSELVELETVSRDLSTSVGNAKPFTTYDLQITAEGYLPVRSVGVPIFGGVTSVENVALIPVPEFGQAGNDEVYQNTEPNL